MNGADAKGAQVLFTNVHVFDGVSEERVENANVLVEDNLIKQISADPITADGATVIDGGRGTLMPGIIEAHGHLSLAAASVPDLLTQLPDYIAIVTATQPEVMLMNGVTTARDMAGAVFGVKKAIDEGLIPGPRIYPSGPMICQTSGHADFRFPNQANPSLGGTTPDAKSEVRPRP